MSNSSTFPTPQRWFSIALFIIFLFSLAIRFWGLTRFNTLVFDEIYFAKFGNNYLTGTTFFNAHPPVSQYLIAIGIWLGSFLPESNNIISNFVNIDLSSVNNLTGTSLSTFSYRWLNALFGSFIPVFIGYIAYYLSSRQSFSLIVALLASLDGLFLVESRYALNNIYIVFFGLLGHLFFLLALKSPVRKPFLLSLAGIFLGTCMATKWNGLGFAFGLYLILIIAAFIKSYNNFLIPLPNKKITSQSSSQKRMVNLPPLWKNLYRYNERDIISNLVILPFVVYSILWIPHLMMNPQFNFIAVHQQIIGFHHRLGNGNDIHPYCSPWYSWLFMQRPIAYFFQRTTNINDLIPNYPPLPSGFGDIIFDVHALGNPILWWLSTAAIFLLLLLFLQSFIPKSIVKNLSHPSTWIVIYIICNYAANMLPWVKVTRCLFIYHYMPAYVFAWLSLAWIIDRFLEKEELVFLGSVITSAIVLAFIFWLPIYLGLPLSGKAYNLRMIFSNWI
jgi:dolichyl-phosphate-mannose--protein O-mannosyl transferase